jgi:hypothetical protein
VSTAAGQFAHLESIWIDRAVVLRREAVDPDDTGVQDWQVTTSPSFKCRLPPRFEGQEQESDPQDHEVFQDERQLTASLTALDGSPVDIRLQDRLRITGTDAQHSGEWEVISCFVPRDGVGNRILWVVTVVRRDEY